MGHQGAGSITELAIQRLLTLQGTMKPHQIISLMTFEGADNTFAMGDHADHIHVGFRPLYGTNAQAAKQVDAILKPEQWIKLIDRLDEIDNPDVARKPSKYAVDADRRAQPGPQGRVATPGYFGFVQWELAGRLGPDPGRYVVRRYAGDEAQQVVVDRRPRRRRGARRRCARPPSPARRRSTSRARRSSRADRSTATSARRLARAGRRRRGGRHGRRRARGAQPARSTRAGSPPPIPTPSRSRRATRS